MSGFWDVFPAQVHGAGRAEASVSTDWEQWSNDVRTFLESALDLVYDGAIGEALGTRAGDINQAAGRLATDVEADGENIAAGATTVTAGEEESLAIQTPALGQAQTLLDGVHRPL